MRARPHHVLLSTVEELADAVFGRGSAISLDPNPLDPRGTRVTVWDSDGREPREVEWAPSKVRALHAMKTRLRRLPKGGA